MCLPGTVEAVRRQVEGQGGPRVSRRTLLAGGVTAAATVAYPQAAGDKPPKQRFEDLTHVLTEEFPVFTFDPPTRETLVTIPSGGFYAQRVDDRRAHGTHMVYPGPLHCGRSAGPGDHPAGTDRADHRGRYLCAGDARPGHGCDRRRPGALRAAPRPDPRRRGRLHELGLGGQGRRPARVQSGPGVPRLPLSGFDLEAAMWRTRRAAGRHRSRSGHAQPRPGNSTTFRSISTSSRPTGTASRTSTTSTRSRRAAPSRLRRPDPLGGGLGRSQPRDRGLVAAWALWLSAAPRATARTPPQPRPRRCGCTRLVPADDLKPSSGTWCLVARAPRRGEALSGGLAAREQRGSAGRWCPAAWPSGCSASRSSASATAASSCGSSPAAQECGGNGTTTSGSAP